MLSDSLSTLSLGKLAGLVQLVLGILSFIFRRRAGVKGDAHEFGEWLAGAATLGEQ